MGIHIYECDFCHMTIPKSEPVRVDSGHFFHTHRPCHKQWQDQEAKKRAAIERVIYREEIESEADDSDVS